MGKKIAEELARAREANRQGNKRRAIHHLKKKKMYEAQLDALATSQLKLQEQVIMLEGSKATSETYGALRSGADAMRRMAKETKIEDVDATMDVINEQTDQMRQVQEALGQPVGFAAELDEDELEGVDVEDGCRGSGDDTAASGEEEDDRDDGARRKRVMTPRAVRGPPTRAVRTPKRTPRAMHGESAERTWPVYSSSFSRWCSVTGYERPLAVSTEQPPK